MLPIREHILGVHLLFTCVRTHVKAGECVHACLCVCVRARARVCVCVCVSVQIHSRDLHSGQHHHTVQVENKTKNRQKYYTVKNSILCESGVMGVRKVPPNLYTVTVKNIILSKISYCARAG